VCGVGAILSVGAVLRGEAGCGRKSRHAASTRNFFGRMSESAGLARIHGAGHNSMKMQVFYRWSTPVCRKSDTAEGKTMGQGRPE
jgi:hypothetical protein